MMRKVINGERVMHSKIIEHARKEGLLGHNDRYPHIPEIMAEGKTAREKIFQDLVKEEDGRNPICWLVWGAYAGIGAVYHWKVDWNGLKSKGVAETLLEPRGSFAMDEYVLDSIGIPFDSSDGKILNQEICNLAMWAFIEFLDDASREVAMSIAVETMQAMYIFGMVYEMENLE